MMTNQLKKKHNPRMTIVCYQVLCSGQFCFQYQLINFVWLSFDFFHLTEASLSVFSWLYTFVFAVVQIYHKCLLSIIIHVLVLPLQSIRFICTTWKREQTMWNNNRTVHVNEQNQNKRKTKSCHIEIDHPFCSLI